MAAIAAGVPVKVLHESEGHTVTVELKNGELYRGQLDVSEDTMNVTLSGVVHTGRDGRVTKLETVFIRGSQIRFVVLPDIVKNAPMFRKVVEFAEKKKKPAAARPGRGRGKGAGAGRGAVGGAGAPTR